MYSVEQTAEFAAWLGELRDHRARYCIQARIDRAVLGSLGDVKPASDGVHEMPIHYGPGYRVYFTNRGKTMILLLCGGDKSNQQQDIRRAIAMAKQLERTQ